MNFGDLKILIYFSWLIPAVILFCAWARIKRKRIMSGFAEKDLLRKIDPSYGSKIAVIKICLRILAVLFILLAIGKPQWGFFWRENTSRGFDIMIALDVSRSMLARDVPPDRLAFAKDHIRSFVNGLKKDRVGLIAFSGQAFLECPLTLDYSGFLLVLRKTHVGIIPKGGTSVSAAIEEALRSYDGSGAGKKLLVLITDGENTEGDIDEVVRDAKKEDVMISCIGLGSSEGDKIRYLDDNGQLKTLTDKEGNEVISSLDEDTLRRLAKETGGIYVKADPLEFGLRKIYEESLFGIEEKEHGEKMAKAPKERFQLFLLIALLFLLADLFLERK